MEQQQKRYGLIGKTLEHSFSPNYFKEKFKREGIKDASYELFSLENILEFQKLKEDKSISGLNVTLPYKEEVRYFMDYFSPEAAAIKAVNCIQIIDGLLIGHNTDVLGFEQSLKPLLKEQHTKALILGTGGAAKAIAFVLSQLKIDFKFVSTQDKVEYWTYGEAEKQLAHFPLIINTTPLGMHPKTEESPLKHLSGIGEQHLVYDLVYNPKKTKLLVQAEQQAAKIKNGLEMLEIQAEESWKIWQGQL